MAYYDLFAEKYVGAESRKSLRDFVYDPSLFEIIGNLFGKKVLDLACGDGRFSKNPLLL